MSLSGSFVTNSVGRIQEGYADSLVFSWTATQDIATNTSLISWSLSGRKTPPDNTQVWGTGSLVGLIKLIIEGKSVYSDTSSSGQRVSPGGTFASGQLSLEHDANGLRGFTAQLSAQIVADEDNSSYSSPRFFDLSGSGSWQLDNIPRLSQLEVSDGTLGVPQTVRVLRKSSGLSHTITAYGLRSEQEVCIVSQEENISWTPKLSHAGSAPASTSVSLTLELLTIADGKGIGTVEQTVTMAIPESVIPTVELSASDLTGYDAVFGAPVQGRSRLRISATPKEAYRSPIRSLQLSANGQSYSQQGGGELLVDTSALRQSGHQTISASASDERGRSGSATLALEVLPYSRPIVRGLQVHRCKEDGSEYEKGRYIRIDYGYEIDPMEGKNTKGVQLQVRQNGSETWTDLPVEPLFSCPIETVILPAEENSSYDVQLILSDYFGAIQPLRTTVSTGFTVLHFAASGKGLAIGKVSEMEGLDVGMPALFRDGLRYDTVPQWEGDADQILLGGDYFVGAAVRNLPEAVSGWLTVKPYNDGEYCNQQYVTYTGNHYTRIRAPNSLGDYVWGQWQQIFAYTGWTG